MEDINGKQVSFNPLPIDSEIIEKDIDILKNGTIVDLESPTMYRELRISEYPPIGGDQLDAIWKGDDFFNEMKTQIMSIKEKYPKII